MLPLTCAFTIPLILGTAAPGAEATMPGLFPVRQFGAVGDGVHDDTEAFRRAVAAAGARVSRNGAWATRPRAAGTC